MLSVSWVCCMYTCNCVECVLGVLRVYIACIHAISLSLSLSPALHVYMCLTRVKRVPRVQSVCAECAECAECMLDGSGVLCPEYVEGVACVLSVC